MEDDEKFMVIDGRRWRRTDPAIPEPFRAQLVRVLMAGRRGVAVAKKSGDDDAMAAARRTVHDAKVALGERGDPWWEEPTSAGFVDRIAATVMSLLRDREDDATICPSEVARTIGGDDWRDTMAPVRAVVADLAAIDVIEVRQGGEVAAADAGGPIRLGRGARFTDGRPR